MGNFHVDNHGLFWRKRQAVYGTASVRILLFPNGLLLNRGRFCIGIFKLEIKNQKGRQEIIRRNFLYLIFKKKLKYS